ncbi:MAG: metal ABC transporter substrate-binding protein [Polyangiaceae bacterium]
MKSLIVTLFALLLAVFAPRAAQAELLVVTTTPDLAAIASAVGGARVKVKALALPTQDPHWVDARPNLALELSRADLLLAVGAELEVGWLPTLQVGSRNGKVQKGAPGYLECSDLVDLLDRPAGKIDRSMGDIHPSGNPHYLFNPRSAERVAVGVARRMAELDPEGKSKYLEQATAFVSELRAARAKWEERLKAVRGREVITFHRSLVYLANWLGLSILDEVESRPGVAPNPAHVADLIARAKQHKVRAVLQESYYPTNTSQLVAQKIGAKLVRLPGGSNFQSGQSYVAFMNQIVTALERAL